MITKLNSSNFEEEINEKEKTVLVDFWAEWCGPCRMLAPVIEEIAEECGDICKVCKVNVDEAPELAGKFRIVSIPTLIVFKNGEVISESVGVQPKEKIIEMIK